MIDDLWAENDYDDLEIFLAEKMIYHAIINIKSRRLEGESTKSGYNIANWVKDLEWMNDDESSFPICCKIAGYDPELLASETIRLAKVRKEDGIEATYSWALGDCDE